MTHSHHFSGSHVLYSIAYICIYNWFLFATPIDDPQSPYTMTFLELLLAVFRFPMVPRQARHFTRNDVASLSCCALCFSSGLAQLGCSEAVRGEICARMKQMDEWLECQSWQAHGIRDDLQLHHASEITMMLGWKSLLSFISYIVHYNTVCILMYFTVGVHSTCSEILKVILP